MEKTKYNDIVDAIDSDITANIFQPGYKLLSITRLSRHYKVSKNTIIRALHILESKDKIEARPKSGFFVKHQVKREEPTAPSFSSIEPSRVMVPELFQDIMLRGAAFDIMPGEALVPPHTLLSKLHRNINRAVRTQATQKAMYYDEPLGLYALREELREHYLNAGVVISVDDVCVSSGCQHSLFLGLSATCVKGDNVVIESPGFYGVIQLLEELGLNAIEVPSHSLSGINIDVLKEVLDKYRITACVVSPAFATPSGSCMSELSKQTLIELANENDFAIIEDDIYGDLGFNTRPKPLKALDTDNRVILCSSFSKTLSRDLRIGWVMGARWQSRIRKLKLVSNLACSQAMQAALAQFMRDGDYKRHLAYKKNTLLIYRDQLVQALNKHWKGMLKFTIPDGGLTIWLELDSTIDTRDIYNTAATKNIIIAPGALFSVAPYFTNFMRLSFNHPTIENREKAIGRLCSIVGARKKDAKKN